MMGGFAIVPDAKKEPAALFDNLEDAIDWAVETFGSDAFSIRWIELVETEALNTATVA